MKELIIIFLLFLIITNKCDEMDRVRGYMDKLIPLVETIEKDIEN